MSKTPNVSFSVFHLSAFLRVYLRSVSNDTPGVEFARLQLQRRDDALCLAPRFVDLA